ncbi:MAG: hypothetical protein AB7S48_15490 [Bacteroidales bacterium]
MKAESITLRTVVPSILLDTIAVLFILLLPSISHLAGFPLYVIDPMRLVLFSAIIFTNKRNSYLIALLLPFVSFIISAHPYFYKVFLISTELLLNVWLFYTISGRFKNLFISTLASILISKVVYYLLKFAFISFLLINDTLVSTSILIQIGVAIFISTLIFFVPTKKSKTKR